MADETKTLAWRLIFETQGIETNTRKAANSLTALESAAAKVTKGFAALGIVASAAAVGKLAIEAIKTADAYTQLANTLRSSTESADELQAVQQVLIQQAADTSMTVEAATAAFNKLHDVTDGLGLSQQELLDLSKALAESMRLSGLNSEQAAAGVDSFANAIEDGTVNIREFKTLVKDSPETIKELAKALGMTKDELRLMAQQGRLSSEMLIEGLGKAAPDIAAKVAGMAPTISAAFDSMKSSFGAMIGEFNEGAGITEGIALGMKDLGGLFTSAAKNAQLLGISVKEVVGTVAVDIESFLNQLFEGFNKLGLRTLQVLSMITTGGLAFHDTLAQQVQESDARVSAFINARRDTIADLKKQADDARKALQNPDLNTHPDKTAVGLTDQQVQASKSIADALLSMTNRASDATKELQALRIEMKDGKQVADAFRAQIAAEAAGRDLKKQLVDQAEKNRVPIDLGKIDQAVAALRDSTTELKLSAEAWGIWQNAMNGARSESDLAQQDIAKLTDAFNLLHKEIGPTAEELALFERAKQQLKDRGNSTQQSLIDTMTDLNHQTAAAKESMAVLSEEILFGADAAEEYRKQIDASNLSETIIEKFTKDMQKSGATLTDEQINNIKILAGNLTEAEVEAAKFADAWELVHSTLLDSMTAAELAALQIKELDDAMAIMAEKGLLTDEMMKAYEQKVKRIQEGASLIEQTWKESVGMMLDNFVNFVSDGQFNFKRFVDSTLQGFARIVTQALLVKSLANTTFGTWLGVKGANGLALDQGRLIPMASGGVVTSPTFFPMAGGATGLMGEAGPEAVMPLARLSSGKLGVNATPQSIEVVNNTGVQASARIERAANRTSIILEAAQLGAQLAEERITRSMRSGYGATSTALQGTYGLRRKG